MNVFLKALGCRLNEAELAEWANKYIQQGHDITQDELNADLIVFNSCSVTAQADKKSRQLLKRYHRNNPTAKIIATGCSSTLNHQTTSNIDGVSLVVNNNQKDDLVSLSSKLIDIPVTFKPLKNKQTSHPLHSRGRERAFIKVQDGCRYRCTFCIVTVARGEEKSKPLQAIIDEINNQVKQGIKEVVLTGVHLGGYGADIGGDLTRMILAVLDNTKIERIRLGSLEPWELTPNFFTLFTNKRIMPHLHLPLQSGSNTILKKMARRCKTDDFYDLITAARNSHPDMNITTDIIVGFPGETEALWLESLAFIEKCNFSHIHIFSYSKREGTKAAGLPDQIEVKDKKYRNALLKEITEKNHLAFLEKQIGKQTEVLWESKIEKMDSGLLRQWGYTANYLRITRDIEPRDLLSNSVSNHTSHAVHYENHCLII